MKAIANLDGVERAAWIAAESAPRIERTAFENRCMARLRRTAGAFVPLSPAPFGPATSTRCPSHVIRMRKRAKLEFREKLAMRRKRSAILTFIGYPCAKKGVNNVMLIIVSRRERTHAFSLSYDKHRVLQKLSRVASARRVNIGVGDAPIAQAEWDRLGVRRHSMIKIWIGNRREKRRSAHTVKTKY